MNEEPDYEIDAYLFKNDRRGPLCDVRLWLPRQPSEDGRIEVVALGVTAKQAAPGGPISIVSDDDKSFRFKAQDVLVRRAVSRLGRKAGGARLTIVHIGTLTIRHGPAVESQRPTNIAFRLSALDYAVANPMFEMDFHGRRMIAVDDHPQVLEMPHPDGFTCSFELERHWNWTTGSGDGRPTLARSCPVFAVQQVPEHASVTIGALTEIASDAALLLSLAARWRVAVHGHIASFGESRAFIEEWRYPLTRSRAYGLEKSDGYLIEPRRLGECFRVAGERFAKLDPHARDAIRLAIVSMHSTSERTVEGAFLAMFFALEGLARQFGQNSGTLASKMAALHLNFPIAIGGLWPVVGTAELPGLAWIRNELAHGRALNRERAGALSVASDHLQLWIEYTLLSVLGVRTGGHMDNWLADQVPQQLDEVAQYRKILGAA